MIGGWWLTYSATSLKESVTNSYVSPRRGLNDFDDSLSALAKPDIVWMAIIANLFKESGSSEALSSKWLYSQNYAVFCVSEIGPFKVTGTETLESSFPILSLMIPHRPTLIYGSLSHGNFSR